MTLPIIGLLGPAGSGKDAVADWLVLQRKFVKVSFSDPIKRFAQAVFAFTNEQLWGPSQARNAPIPVDEAYWVQCRQRFGLVFKDFIHSLFPEDFGNPRSLRVLALEKLLRWHGVIEQVSKKGMEQTLEPGMLTPRLVLQTLGTEWGRMLDPDIWSRYVFKVIVPHLEEGYGYGCTVGACKLPCGRLPFGASPDDYVPKGIVIPDHRFKNEVIFTNTHGGRVYKLERPGRAATTVGIPGHASETDQEAIGPEHYKIIVCPEGLENLHATLRMWAELVL